MGHSTETVEQHKTVHKNSPAKKKKKVSRNDCDFLPHYTTQPLAFIGTQLLTLGKVVEEIAFK